MRYMLRTPALEEGEMDDLFRNAVEVVVDYDRASASMLQRRLETGTTRSKRSGERHG